jgi:hypothetical protein
VSVCDAYIKFCLRPPSPLPMWQWWEAFITLDNTSAAPGKRISTKRLPMLRWFSRFKQDPRCRRLVMMVSAQSTKTQNAINSLLHDIAEDPAPAMWVMANADHCEEFAKKRLFPAVEDCEKTKDLLPAERNRRNKRLIQFDSMNLMLRGSNSRQGLQSDPIRRLYLDERREWKKGAIDLVRKRTRTFHNFIEISMGTAGTKDDELHCDYREGNQVIPHFRCPKCQHSQPFRFGRKESVLFPTPRAKGGLEWDENPVTRPGGKWLKAEVVKTVRFVCENADCDATWRNHEKMALIKAMHPAEYGHSTGPKLLAEDELAVPDTGIVSMHWNTLCMPFPGCAWEGIVWEFLKACDAYKLGNVEPLKAFVTETLGEPWEERGQRPTEHALRKQCGGKAGMAYVRGPADGHPFWLPSEQNQVTTVLTGDVQAAEGGYLKWVVRQWKATGDSRLLDYGWCRDYDDLKEIQIKFGCIDDCVFVDSGWGPGTSKCYRACLDWNWKPMKGDDGDYFSVYVLSPTSGQKVSRNVPWKLGEVDPSLGKVGQGRIQLPLLHWKHSTYRDRLLLHIAVGRGPLWLLPDDVGDDYLTEMTGNERIARRNPNGSVDYEWVKRGPDDWQDCELEQLAVVDAGGVAVAGEEKET